MPYIPNTDRDREEMLRVIGASSVEDLFSAVPAGVRLRGPLEVPGPLSEIELARHVGELAAMNRTAETETSFLGGGFYDHAVPAAVRHVTRLPHFYTAYTPYQAEASQGTLQAIYEFQSLIARLTDMEVANASMYDGATAAAEACLMALDRGSGRRRIVVASTVSPATRAVVRTYLLATGAEIVEVPHARGVTDAAALRDALSGASGLLFQHPNHFGLLEPAAALSAAAREAGALAIASVDPVSLGVLAAPGSYGADIAVGEGQSLGSPMGFGGPLLGFMAAGKKLVRRLPGRIIAATQDASGRRGYVMTLQTREQHIRREKAASNICTNEGLVALAATVYLSLLGKQGFRDLAVQITSKARYAAEALSGVAGVRRAFPGPFFREFVVELPMDARTAADELAKARIWPGTPCAPSFAGMERCLLVSVNEQHARHDIDSLASALDALIASRRAP
ncbi:MAG: aminomethyl-transferring glycine dehydrogenase subunit GcvPA [Candidatus Eisenbacteria bacterium]|nr:aminomethyl-transferring glycine dehydrogenase subunit GcvPA [Candidatus Eisenbacteria bacterium]